MTPPSREAEPDEARAHGPEPAGALSFLTPARVFLALGGVFALLFAAFTPPLGSPDEHVHLVRAVLISEGRLGVPGRAPHARETMPRSLLTLHEEIGHADFQSPPRRFSADEILALAERPLAPRDRILVGFVGTYGPIAYVPQALAMLPARLAGLGPVPLVYAGRLGNVAVFLAAGWLAITLAPRRALALALFLLLPMNVALAASLSADVPTLALVVVFVALCARLALAPGVRVRSRDAAALVAIAALLALAKPAYVLVVGMLALIPVDRFGDRRRALRIAGSVGAAMGLTVLLWTWLTVIARPTPAGALADPGAQLRHILTHPADFLQVLARSIATHLPGLWRSGVGVLGHLNIPLAGWVYAAVPLALVGASVVDPRDPPQLDGRRRLLLVLLFLASTVGIFTIGYVGWNPVGHDFVLGIQGRYLTPLIPLLLLAVPALGGDAHGAWRPWLASACVLVAAAALVAALAALVSAFYG